VSGWWGWSDEPEVRAAMEAGASQDPWELAAAVDLVRDLGPQVIVEIGCDRGGTLLAWRGVCERVYGVTLADNSGATGGSGLPLETYGATVVTGNSHAPWTRAALLREIRGGWSCSHAETTAPCGMCAGCAVDWDAARSERPVDVLFIDGDHSASGVRSDVAMYGPLVREGGLILLHDIHSVPDGLRPVEVPQVWAELAGRYDTTEITNPVGPAQGWGVIRVTEGARFAEPAPGAASRHPAGP
jgi:hypothetical protein